MAKTEACGIIAVMIGKSKPTANEPIQLKADAKPPARPRMASGKISPTKTQVNGAQVNDIEGHKD